MAPGPDPGTSPGARLAARRSPGDGALRTEHQTALRGAVGARDGRYSGVPGSGRGAGHARPAAPGRVDRVVRAVRSLPGTRLPSFGVSRTTRPDNNPSPGRSARSGRDST